MTSRPWKLRSSRADRSQRTNPRAATDRSQSSGLGTVTDQSQSREPSPSPEQSQLTGPEGKLFYKKDFGAKDLRRVGSNPTPTAERSHGQRRNEANPQSGSNPTPTTERSHGQRRNEAKPENRTKPNPRTEQSQAGRAAARTLESRWGWVRLCGQAPVGVQLRESGGSTPKDGRLRANNRARDAFQDSSNPAVDSMKRTQRLWLILVALTATLGMTAWLITSVRRPPRPGRPDLAAPGDRAGGAGEPDRGGLGRRGGPTALEARAREETSRGHRRPTT